MKVDDYNILKEMLAEFQQEESEIEGQLKAHGERILDIEARLKVFENDEPEDFKVFSPRNPESIHREEISRIKAEKSAYEEKDRELAAKKKFLGSYAAKLKKVLKSQEKENSLKKKEAGELRDASIQKLEQLVHKIEQSSAMVVTNPIQARQDFAVIGQCLKETIDQMRGTVWIR